MLVFCTWSVELGAIRWISLIVQRIVQSLRPKYRNISILKLSDSVCLFQPQISVTYRGSPRPSPRLRRSNSRGSQRSQRSSSWRLKHSRRNGDKTSLVVDSMSDSADDVDDDLVSSSQNSQSPTYSPGVPISPGVNNQRLLYTTPFASRHTCSKCVSFFCVS